MSNPLPCINCITLPMCKSRAFDNSTNSILVKVTSQCSILTKYCHDEEPQSRLTHNDKLIDFYGTVTYNKLVAFFRRGVILGEIVND